MSIFLLFIFFGGGGNNFINFNIQNLENKHGPYKPFGLQNLFSRRLHSRALWFTLQWESFISRQGEEAMMSSMESLQLSDAVHLCSVTQEQVSINQTQLVAATLSELVPIRAAYLQAFSDQQKVAIHSRYLMLKLLFSPTLPANIYLWLKFRTLIFFCNHCKEIKKEMHLS